jgi:hypothetical protein
VKHKVGSFEVWFEVEDGKVVVNIGSGFLPLVNEPMDSLDAAAMAVDLKNVAESAAKEKR